MFDDFLMRPFRQKLAYTVPQNSQKLTSYSDNAYICIRGMKNPDMDDGDRLVRKRPLL